MSQFCFPICSGVGLAPKFNPAARRDAHRIAVRPVHQSAAFVPLVHTAKSQSIAEADRNPVGQIDIVGDQERMAIAQLEDHALMARAISVVRQQTPDDS